MPVLVRVLELSSRRPPSTPAWLGLGNVKAETPSASTLKT